MQVPGKLNSFRVAAQTCETVANSLGYPPELYAKCLLLKSPYTRVIVNGEIKLVFTLKLHPYWLTFIVLQDVMLP